VFSDYAGGLLLSEPEIDRERGIILSEKRASDSVGFRTFVAQLEAKLGTTRFRATLPIGTQEVISAAPRGALHRLLEHVYRPERMAVVAVGDFPIRLRSRSSSPMRLPRTPRAHRRGRSLR
jgi:zinc protease